jgi:hypothetical protein
MARRAAASRGNSGSRTMGMNGCSVTRSPHCSTTLDPNTCSHDVTDRYQRN